MKTQHQKELNELEREYKMQSSFMLKKVKKGKLAKETRIEKLELWQVAIDDLKAGKTTTEKVLKALKAELKQRDKFYKIWIQAGRLNRDRAAIQYRGLRNAIYALTPVVEIKQQQQTLF